MKKISLETAKDIIKNDFSHSINRGHSISLLIDHKKCAEYYMKGFNDGIKLSENENK
jgi:hypothetical protein